LLRIIHWMRWLLFLAVLCVGCSTTDGPQNYTISTDRQGNVVQTTSNGFQLKANVKELPESAVVSAITDTTVTISGPVPNLAAGDVIIKNEGDQQFLRKVVSVTTAGGTTVVTTARAVLTDVFDSAAIAETIHLGPTLLKELTPAMPGVTFGEPFQISPRGEEVASWGLPITFSNAQIGSNARGSVIGNGFITIRISLYKDLQLGVRNLVVPTVNHFALVPKVTVEGNLTITGQGSGEFSQEFPLTGKFDYPLAGFGPVSLNLSGQLMVGVDGYVQANSELKMTGRVGLEAGIEATADQWKTVSNFDAGFSITPPKIDAEARLNVNMLAPRISLNLLGMGSAWVDSNMLRLEAEASFNANPSPQYNVVVYRQFSIDAGAHLTLGVSPLAVSYDAAFPVFDGSRTEVARVTNVVPTQPLQTRFMPVVPATLSLKPGEQALVFPMPFVGGTVPLFIPQPCVYRSANPSICKVRNYGFLAVAEGVAGGTTTLTVIAPNGVQTPVQATVASAGIASIDLRGGGVLTFGKGEGIRPLVLNDDQLPERGRRNFQAIARYSDGSESDITNSVDWSASGNGQTSRSGDVLARSTGQFNLSVSGPGGRTASRNLTVVRPRAFGLTISPLLPQVASANLGTPVQLQALGWYEDGSLRIITNSVQWTSGDPNTATVNANGTVTPVAVGEAAIGCYDPESGLYFAKKVQVGGAMTALRVTPTTTTTFDQGTTTQFRAYATFTGAGEREVTSRVTWNNSNNIQGRITSAGALTFKGLGNGSVSAFFNGRTATSSEFSVRGPAGLRITQQPGNVSPGASFETSVEVLGSDGQVFSGPTTVNLELDGGAANANLAGTLNRVAQGLVQFTGLSIDQSGSGYFLRAFAYGLSVAESEFFQVTSGGGGGFDPGYILLTDRNAGTGVGGLRSVKVGSNGELGASNIVDTAGRPQGMTRLGNFVYVVNSGTGNASNSVDCFAYNQLNGALQFVFNSGVNAVGATPGQPIEVETNGSDTIFALPAFDKVLFAVRADPTTGQLTLSDSVVMNIGDPLTAPNGMLFYDTPGSTTDYLFVADQANNRIHVVVYDAVAGTVNHAPNSPFANPLAAGPTAGGGPLDLAMVNNHLYAINPSANRLTVFDFNSSTGQLSTQGDTYNTGQRPLSIFSVGDKLYVGNDVSMSVSGFKVGTDGGLLPINGGNDASLGDSNPHAFIDLALNATQRIIYVATSTKVAGLLMGNDGLLVPATNSPYSNLGGSPGAIRF
jgi:6-phosphogluconolactonase (cycloisomerase 2 family)